MRLALDATYALDPQPTGVARYSRRLISALATRPDLRMTLAARPHRFRELGRQFPESTYQRCLLQEPLNFVLPHRVDVFHALNQRLPRYKFRRAVTTIHDVFALSSDRYSTPDFRSKFGAMILDAVRRSDALISVSAYTRDELCRITGVDRAKVTVVHHGIDIPRSAQTTRAQTPYFLSVGVVQTRKNTLAAVRAIEKLPPSITLKVAGSATGHGAQETVEYVRRQGLTDRVHFLGHCDEAELDRLYAGASALLFPSFEEGFGFPVLEAMARGTPVIASNTSSIPEIAGNAAMLFDPLDHEGMREACAQILDDSQLRARLSEAGKRQASGFTWEKAAKETLAVYRGSG